MRITDQIVVPASTPDFDAVLRNCRECSKTSWHVPQKVMVMSAGGTRSMRLWACEAHPLPQFVTDDPSKDT